MTDPTTPPTDAPRPDTDHAPHADADASGPASSASQLFDSIREAVEDLAERAAPALKEFGVKAAEFAADAADKAAPLVRRAGAATADASGKLAEKSRAWASDQRHAADAAVDGVADAATEAAGAAADAAADATTDATDAAPDIDASAGR